MCNWSSKFVLKAVFHLSTVARIEDCYVTTFPLNACIYVSQCSKTLCLSFKQLYKKKTCIWNSQSFVICGFKSTKRCKFTWNTVRAWHFLLQFYISPSQWPFNQRYGTAGTSRLLWIFYILCLAVTCISTEMKFKPIS